MYVPYMIHHNTDIHICKCTPLEVMYIDLVSTGGLYVCKSISQSSCT